MELRALVCGILIFGFQALIFRSWDLASGRVILFFILAGVFFCSSLGALAYHVFGSRLARFNSEIVSSLALTLAVSGVAVTLMMAFPRSQWHWQDIYRILAASTVFLSCGFAQIAVFHESSRPTRPLLFLTVGGLIGNLVLGLLEFFSFLTVARILVMLAATLIAVAGFKSWGGRVLGGTVLMILLSLLPLKAPESHPKYAGGRLYGNSFSKLKVARLEPGVARGRKLRDSGESIVRPGYENVNVYTVIRNAKEASLIFDAEKFEDLVVLRDNLSYRLIAMAKPGLAAVVGAGAASEVQMALLAGFAKVEAIEINPLMIGAVNDFLRHPEFAYRHPRVKVAVEDGRRYFRHLEQDHLFDLIVLTNVRYFGSSGARLFTENNIHTKDSLRDMVKHLAPGGILVLRNNGGSRNFHRVLGATLMAAAREAGLNEGVEIFISRIPDRISQDLIGNHAGVLFVLTRGSFSLAHRQYLMNVVTGGQDQRFFETAKMKVEFEDLIATDRRPFPDWLADRLKGRDSILWWIIGLLMGLAVAVPVFLGIGGRAATTFYAFVSGAAFLGFEFVYLWRVDLSAGLPGWGALSVMSSLLISSALGTWLAGQCPDVVVWWRRALALMILVSLVYWPISEWTVGLNVHKSLSLIISSLMVALPGLLMGFSFGLFLREKSALSPRLIAIIFACSGAGGLAAGIGLKLVSLEWGYDGVYWLSVLGYVTLCILAHVSGRLKINALPCPG